MPDQSEFMTAEEWGTYIWVVASCAVFGFVIGFVFGQWVWVPR